MNKVLRIGIVSLSCLLPQLSSATTGCNNGYLLGNYNAQISNMNLQMLLNTINGAGTTSPGTQAATVTGFANNPLSLSGSLPGSGRYYFDGNGGVVGVTATGSNAAVGNYSVADDCTATVTLASGATFDAVLAQGGKQVFFVETDTTGVGAIGVLEKSSSCVNLNYPQNFAFNFAGATPVAPTGTTTVVAYVPWSSVGTLSLNGAGNFSIAETRTVGGVPIRAKGSGTYTVDYNCNIMLAFSSYVSAGATKVKAPTTFSALTSDGTKGLLILQADASTTMVGTFVVQ